MNIIILKQTTALLVFLKHTKVNQQSSR